MSKSISLVAVLVAGLLQLCCGSTDRFPLRLRPQTERGLLEAATIVVVATAIKADDQEKGRSLEWKEQPGVSNVALVRVVLKVEQVIRGHLAAGNAVVYYWAAGVFTNASGLHSSFIGMPAIHYLVEERGSLRYVTDVVRSATLIASGGHSLQTLPRTEAAQIATILLMPGTGVDYSLFTHELHSSVIRSIQLAGYMGTLPLLRGLLRNPKWEVRWGACKALHELSFAGQDGCLETESFDARNHSLESEWQRMIQSKASFDSMFKDAFLHDPIDTAKSRAILPGAGDVRDYLELISLHPDRQLAQRAQKALENIRTGDSSKPVSK